MLDELRNLSPGQLQMWRRNHLKEIRDYFEEHGAKATMERYRFVSRDALDRLLYRPLQPFRQQFTKVDRADSKSDIAIAAANEAQKQINELKQQYQMFVESVGEQLALKFFLPMLRSVIKVSPELYSKPDDTLILDSLFGEKPLGLQSPEPYDAVIEAEELLQKPLGDNSISLSDRIKAAWSALYEAYIEACDREDWYAALAIYQCMYDHDLIEEYDEGDELVQNFKEWIAKAQKPDELYVCY